MIVGTQLITEVDNAGLTVEFVDDAGNVVSVRLAGQEATRQTAVAQARKLLEELVVSGALPDTLEDAKNQDGRAATLASSKPVAHANPADADASAEDDVAHGRRTPSGGKAGPDGVADRMSEGAPQRTEGKSDLVNPDATPGTGMFPSGEDEDENMQPSS